MITFGSFNLRGLLAIILLVRVPYDRINTNDTPYRSPWCCCSHIGDTVVTNTDISTRHVDTVTTFTGGGKLGLIGFFAKLARFFKPFHLKEALHNPPRSNV